MSKIRDSVKPFSDSAVDGLALAFSAVGAAVILAFISAKVMEPAWVASGWPSYNQYPKNIELGALKLILLAMPLIGVIFYYLRPRILRVAVSCVLVLISAALSYKHLYLVDAWAWLWPLLSFAFIISFMYHAFKLDNLDERAVKPVYLFIAGAVAVLFLFFSNTAYIYFINSRLDLHHFGERFTSALDLLAGGSPFSTFFWPHGLHDTGAAALAFSLVGKADLPTLFLADSASLSLAAATLLMMAYGLRLGLYSILILFAALLLNDALLLSTLGMMPLVIASFLLFAKGKKWYAFFIAGVLAFGAHLYRIDYGIYGAASVAGLVFCLTAWSLISKDLTQVRRHIVSFVLYLAGILAFAVLMRVLFGWPDSSWYRIIFGILPKYLGDSGGFAFPLPVNWLEVVLSETRNAVFYVAATLTLLAFSAMHMYRAFKEKRDIDRFFFLLVFLSVVSLRTAFGRSEEMHIQQFSIYAYLVILLYISKAIVSFRINPAVKIISLVLFFSLFNFRTGAFGSVSYPPYRQVITDAASIMSSYGEDPPQQCSNGIFSKRDLDRPSYAYFDRSVCEMRDILSSFNIKDKELLIGHSASLAYPALGYSLPTKYYCLGWAITDDMQKELIGELEKAGVKAILRVAEVQGIRALTEYDVPDSHRMPLYWAWVENRFDVERPVKTPLGDLFLSRAANAESIR